MFGRKKSAASAGPSSTDSASSSASASAAGETTTPRTGPFDADSVPDEVQRVDLGSLRIAPSPGRELRLQVDEQSGEVQSVLLAGADGAMELRAFAAPRGGDLWSEVMPQLAADVARRGGTATERSGPWGPELLCRVPVAKADGTPGGIQSSRMIGVNGARWLVRATLLGQPATQPDSGQEWEDALAGLVVSRGDGAMPVGDPLPLRLPPDAKRAE
jgi:hypothetical protein